MSVDDVIAAHRAAGRRFEADGVSSFVREAGDGEPVVCLHGVPASCFLYRKVIAELAARGRRGIAFDLPGLGLADRPPAFDYSFSGLGRFCRAAVDALGLDRFHLVVHDIGGPVGFELATAMPSRIASLTILDTIIDVDEFHRPWEMRPFAAPVVGWLWLRSLNHTLFRALWYRTGILDRSAMTRDEVGAYLEILRMHDGGAAFLKIMRGFELTSEKRAQYLRAVRDVPYPVQVIWGADDRALTLADHGARMTAATGVPVLPLRAGHFLQEEQAPALAERISSLIAEQ